LGQDNCTDPSHIACDRTIIIDENHVRIDERPRGFDEAKYWNALVEFTNLGRLPLVGVTLSATAVFEKERAPENFKVSLGNIPVNHHIHLEIFFWLKFGQPTVTWVETSARQGDGTTISFHPDKLPTKGRLVIPFGQTIAQPNDFSV